MRVLFTTTGSAGHLTPLIPFAEAVRRAGGDVLVATRASSAEDARRTGFAVQPFPDAPAQRRARLMAALRELPTEEANARAATDVFGGVDADAAIPGVRRICAAWRPDVVVSEPSEFAGRLVAAHLGLPAVTVSITQYAVEQRMEGPMEAARDRLRAAHGLRDGDAPTPFTLMPPVLEHPEAPGPTSVRRFREAEAEHAPLADRWDGADAPLVYLTFGSVAPQQDALFPALYRAAIDALAPLPARVLVTIGRRRDPAALGPLPANVHVHRWVAQGTVLPHAAAVVCHGGSGTVRGALAAGVPLVVLPLFADQPDNAARVHEIGAGLALPQGAGSVAGMADAVRTVLTDARYARNAAAVAADIAALPPVDTAAARLQALLS